MILKIATLLLLHKEIGEIKCKVSKVLWLLEHWQCLSQTWGVIQLSFDSGFLLLERLFLDLNVLFQMKEQVIVASGMIRNGGMV